MKLRIDSRLGSSSSPVPYTRCEAAGLPEVRRGEGTFVAERPPQARAAERERLLEEGARRVVEVARTVGASRKEASGVVEGMWKKTTEGGEGKDR